MDEGGATRRRLMNSLLANCSGPPCVSAGPSARPNAGVRAALRNGLDVQTITVGCVRLLLSTRGRRAIAD